MSRTPFTREYGATQGRVVQPAGWSPPADGSCAFVLGCDREGDEVALEVGDYHRVAQTVNVTGMKVIRMRVRVKPPSRAWVETVATEPWKFIDGDDLVVRVGGGAPQTVVFHTADFVDQNNARAYEIARVLNARVVGSEFTTLGYSVIGRSTLNPAGGGWTLELVGGSMYGDMEWRHLAWHLEAGVGAAVYGSVLMPPATAARTRTRTFTFGIPTARLFGDQSVWVQIKTVEVSV